MSEPKHPERVTCRQLRGGITCPNRAAFRYTWTGTRESLLCEDCAPRALQVASALGFELELIALDPELERRVQGEAEADRATMAAELERAGECIFFGCGRERGHDGACEIGTTSIRRDLDRARAAREAETLMQQAQRHADELEAIQAKTPLEPDSGMHEIPEGSGGGEGAQ